ncbi:MAG: 3-deoxy-manno-octulosonate cytidylyltransferase [Cyclobacteriaceae bacterium]|jgi:3-deoxy-manno-octulosonate cytidylyltransferase (CMP-KDO synthetase)|nr:3-deoxy-manno-octulosonate cytidylyltransferase [Cyclobacteriaceae bacterium]
MRILGVIPARYASTRFPAKPLVDLNGKSMIRRVYEQASKSKYLNKVVVATDHEEIYRHVNTFGGEVCMTSPQHASGTDRCYEVLTKEKGKFDYVINIQGDEPFIAPEQIDLLASLLDGKTELATLIKKIGSVEQLLNPNLVKVVCSKNQEALYFSRSVIPYFRNMEQSEWVTHHTYYKHIGMYAYRADVLGQITKLEISSLEKTESLEQLRWLENGFHIKVKETNIETIGIDTPEDLEKAIEYLASIR